MAAALVLQYLLLIARNTKCQKTLQPQTATSVTKLRIGQILAFRVKVGSCVPELHHPPVTLASLVLMSVCANLLSAAPPAPAVTCMEPAQSKYDICVGEQVG